MAKITDGDVERALALLPSPMFRPRDIYDVADELFGRRYRYYGNALWYLLEKRGRIVRTGTLIGRAKRRFYWQRTPGA